MLIVSYHATFAVTEKDLAHSRHWYLVFRNTENRIRQESIYAGAMPMDLSKAFDTLNNDLLIAKLYPYGVSEESLK